MKNTHKNFGWLKIVVLSTIYTSIAFGDSLSCGDLILADRDALLYPTGLAYDISSGRHAFFPPHFEGNFTVAGEFGLDPDMMTRTYGGLRAENFGGVTFLDNSDKPLVSRVTGNPAAIRDQHYLLGLDPKDPTGKTPLIGIRPIPIIDREGLPKSDAYNVYPRIGKAADGTEVRGAEILDKHLREQFGYGPDDTTGPIYSILVYTHPEIKSVKLEEMGKPEHLIGEMRKTHMGAYIGEGKTRNSPFNYEQQKLNARGYPIQAVLIGFQGAKDQRTFNTNALITLRLLNEFNGGPIFPSDYKFDFFATQSLKDVLEFYRAWVDPTWVRPEEVNSTDPERKDKPFFKILQRDPRYATYCAEHQTIILNAALNIPQNEKGYQEIWGNEVGADLFAKARAAFKAVTGQEMPVIDPDSYIPLWQLEKIANPLSITEPGASLAWAPESTADIVADFVETYADFTRVESPVVPAAAILGFMAESIKRMEITPEIFLKTALPFIAKIFLYDATTRFKGVPEAMINQAIDAYIQANRAPLMGLLEKLPGVDREALAKTIFSEIENKRDWIAKNQWDVAVAKDNFLSDPEVEAAMKAAVSLVVRNVTDAEIKAGKKRVQFYAPPAVLSRIEMGLHPSNPFVFIHTTATIFDAVELRRQNGDTTLVPVPGP